MSKSVITLGTFDGVHRGHQALLKKVASRAQAIRAASAALLFDMPPRHAGEPLPKPVLLTTLSEKLHLIRRFGIHRIQVLVFDRKTAMTPPEDFFRDTIVKKHAAREMVVGPKVAFGKNRAGRLPLLRRLGKNYGVRIHVVREIGKGVTQVSSRRIRGLLAKGKVQEANALLGYAYSVAGKVIHGQAIGRQIGFPTANIQVDAGKILPPGVFYVKVNGWDAVCNIGSRPTFTPHSHTLRCEVFILRPASDVRRRTRLSGRRFSNVGGASLYGRRLRVVFLRRLRQEKRFSSPAALRRQIAKDVALATHLAKGYHDKKGGLL